MPNDVAESGTDLPKTEASRARDDVAEIDAVEVVGRDAGFGEMENEAAGGAAIADATEEEEQAENGTGSGGVEDKAPVSKADPAKTEAEAIEDEAIRAESEEQAAEGRTSLVQTEEDTPARGASLAKAAAVASTSSAAEAAEGEVDHAEAEEQVADSERGSVEAEVPAVDAASSGVEEDAAEGGTGLVKAEQEVAESAQGPTEAEEADSEVASAGVEEDAAESKARLGTAAVAASTIGTDGSVETLGGDEADPAEAEGVAETGASPEETEKEVAETDKRPAEVEEVPVGEAGPAGAEEEPAESGAGPAAAVVAASQSNADRLEERLGEAGADSAEAEEGAAATDLAGEEEKKKRRRLVFLLLALLALLLCATAIFGRYLLQPVPLPELLPVPGNVNYPPHHLFSIPGVEAPVGVALSPDGDRIYATETGGERLVRVFGPDGSLLHSFAPPRTNPAQRAPVYVAVDGAGRIFVTDRLQHAVFVFDRDGNHLDAILGPDLTLSEYVSEHVADLQPGAKLAYNAFESEVFYQGAGEVQGILPLPSTAGWSPLGIRVAETGSLLLTDVSGEHHCVRQIVGDAISASSWRDFDPPQIAFGTSGQDSGEFLFPNSAVADSQGRIYVTDGNNGRISVWSEQGEFLYSFGQGAGDGALSLPRGAAIDGRDRLHVVDTVEQNVKVYDVSGLEPRFLFAFGEWGDGDGRFNYPNDIALDATGRLYVADRENNLIQVWSY